MNIPIVSFARSLITGSATLLAIFLCFPHAAGQTLTTHYQTGFESPTYTQAALAGQDGWSASSIGTVVGTVGTISPPEGSQMLQITRPTSGDPSVFSNAFAGFNEGAKEDFLFSFKITADVKSNAAVMLSIGATNKGSNGAWVGLRPLGASGVDGFGFHYRDGVTGSYVRLGTETLTLGEFYRFDLLVDFETDTFSVAVYNSSNVLQGSASNISVYTSATTYEFYNRIYSNQDQVGATKFYIDDIIVQQIPEPSAVFLTLAGAAFLLLLRRGKFHRQIRSFTSPASVSRIAPAALVALAIGTSGPLVAEEVLFQAHFEKDYYFEGELHPQNEWSATPNVEIVPSPTQDAPEDAQVVLIKRHPGDTEAAARNNFLPYNSSLKQPFFAEATLAVSPVTDYQNASFVVQDSSAGEPGAWAGIRAFNKEGYWLTVLDGSSWDNDWIKLDSDPDQEGIQSAEVNTLYRFLLEIHPEDNTFNITVFSEDGKKLDHREGVRIRNPERMNSGGFNRITFYMGGGSHGDVAYYDSVRVWTD